MCSKCSPKEVWKRCTSNTLKEVPLKQSKRGAPQTLYKRYPSNSLKEVPLKQSKRGAPQTLYKRCTSNPLKEWGAPQTLYKRCTSNILKEVHLKHFKRGASQTLQKKCTSNHSVPSLNGAPQSHHFSFLQNFCFWRFRVPFFELCDMIVFLSWYFFLLKIDIIEWKHFQITNICFLEIIFCMIKSIL